MMKSTRLLPTPVDPAEQPALVAFDVRLSENRPKQEAQDRRNLNCFDAMAWREPPIYGTASDSYEGSHWRVVCMTDGSPLIGH
jgi:hypothetical protein